MTGIVPYYVVITGAHGGFWVAWCTPPGVREADVTWLNQEGRLFAQQANIYDYPPVDQILTVSESWATARVEVRNREDGTGSIMISIKGEDTVTMGERKDIPLEELYRPVPQWGHWHELADSAPLPDRASGDAGKL